MKLIDQGAKLFSATFTPEQGLGPLFNQVSCRACHSEPTLGGVGPGGLGTATRVGRMTAEGFDSMADHGGPIARSRSVRELGLLCDLEPGIPSDATLTSVRNAPSLYGDGQIDKIPDEVIVAGALRHRDGVHGRVHWVITRDGQKRVGRFGWKADTATLKQFVADALRNEIGITNPLAPLDILPVRNHPPNRRCPGEGERGRLEDKGLLVEAITAFVASLPPPMPRPTSGPGRAIFSQIGCDVCHTPSLPVGEHQLRLYSDLLLHNLGPSLDDKFVQGNARGTDWRTTPLWGLHTRPRLLHDGRAHSVAEAILAHEGEGEAAKDRFRRLPVRVRDFLLTFLDSL